MREFLTIDIIIVIDKERRNYRILYRDNALIEKIIEPLIPESEKCLRQV